MHNSEKDILQMKQLLHTGNVCLDIGACFGIYTYWMSKSVGMSGRVISIEPILENFYYLTGNVVNNDLKNVEVLNNAVWDKYGFVHMVKPTMYTGHVTDTGEIKALALTIGDIFKFFDLEKIDFIKVDGGSDLSVHSIFGGKKLIEKFKPILLLECDLIKHKELFDYLESIGYLVNKKHVSDNYFFIPKGD
jgi:FkbM family methyltransferase